MGSSQDKQHLPSKWHNRRNHRNPGCRIDPGLNNPATAVEKGSTPSQFRIRKPQPAVIGASIRKSETIELQSTAALISRKPRKFQLFLRSVYSSPFPSSDQPA